MIIKLDLAELLDSITNSEMEAIALEKKNAKRVAEEIARRYGIRVNYDKFSSYFSQRFGMPFNGWYKNEVEAKILMAVSADIPIVARKHNSHYGPRSKA